MNHCILLNYCTLWHLFEWSTAVRIECILIVRLPLMLAEIFNHFDSFYKAKSFFLIKNNIYLTITYDWPIFIFQPLPSGLLHCNNNCDLQFWALTWGLTMEVTHLLLKHQLQLCINAPTPWQHCCAGVTNSNLSSQTCLHVRSEGVWHIRKEMLWLYWINCPVSKQQLIHVPLQQFRSDVPSFSDARSDGKAGGWLVAATPQRAQKCCWSSFTAPKP